MDKWQQQTIIHNLPELIHLTRFNDNVKAKLLAKHILTPIDVEQLDAESERKGKTKAAYNYYQCLMTRVGAYNILAKILEENQQTGAVRILQDGIRNLGIHKELGGFNDAEIDVQGKSLKLCEFFETQKLGLVQQIFRYTIPGQDIYDSFVKKKQTFVLATSSIPPEPPIYIPRFLSNRIEVDQSIFKTDCPDVFVFKNTIPRYKLSEVVNPHSTDTSTSQLTKITCRFIHLDEIEDWYELKKSAKVPIHLINFETNRKIYLLEDTTATSEILNKVGSKKERIYLSEDEFVQQQVSEKVSSVCICDTPGMGKTFLLANIARIMSTTCTGTIVVFMQLPKFVADLSLSSTKTTMAQDAIFLNVFKCVSPSWEHAKLLLRLVEADLLQVKIFFDGFDEIPSDKVEWMKQVFLFIKGKLKNVRIYITSRPHMRHELEKSLGVIAYDILPFNLENQVDFQVQFWSPKVPQLDQTLLANYAKTCLKEINKTLTRNDKEMAGIPLLCRLIAEVYANKVYFYFTTGTKNLDFPVKIAAMDQQFVELRFKHSFQSEDKIKDIKLLHIWHALKLIFPTNGFHDDEIFSKVNQLMASGEVLNAGIVQFQSDTKLDFIHRTFAEYFAAEYFSEKLQSTAVKPKKFLRNIFNTNFQTNQQLIFILNLILEINETPIHNLNDVTFIHSVVVSFVDFRLNKVTIPEETTSQLASCCASISTEKFLKILCSCCNQNLHSLFSILKKAVMKWNWNQKKFYFTTKNSFELLEVCIRKSTGQMFRSCAQLLTEVLQLDLENICMYNKTNTLLHIAVKATNYEAVEYLLNRVSIKLPTILEKCVYHSDYNNIDIIRRKENILQLLLNKNPTLIQETPDILFDYRIHLVLFKMLVKLGANLTAVDSDGDNCAMVAAKYMSSSDFHQLVQFLLTECKVEYLFLDHKKWRDPFLHIIKHSKLLPETLELLLNIPGIAINMKDEKGENLLFSAVEGNNVNNFQLLVNSGLDYKARGLWNRSLLHVAVLNGKFEMIRYFLSLGMDPNSRDEEEWTSLHHAVFSSMLAVVKVLVKNGANVHAKNILGQTSLHLAAQNANFGLKIIKYLIKKGLGVNDRDNYGNTPLHLCEDRENKECLLEMGADIHVKNISGKIAKQDLGK